MSAPARHRAHRQAVFTGLCLPITRSRPCGLSVRVWMVSADTRSPHRRQPRDTAGQSDKSAEAANPAVSDVQRRCTLGRARIESCARHDVLSPPGSFQRSMPRSLAGLQSYEASVFLGHRSWGHHTLNLFEITGKAISKRRGFLTLLEAFHLSRTGAALSKATRSQQPCGSSVTACTSTVKVFPQQKPLLRVMCMLRHAC